MGLPCQSYQLHSALSEIVSLVSVDVSRVAENRQICKSTKEILRSEFRATNKTGQQ